MKSGHVLYVLVVIGSVYLPSISPIESQTTEIFIQDVQLEFFDKDSDSYNDTVKVSFYIDFTSPIVDNYTVELNLFRPNLIGYYGQEFMTLNTQDNVSNYNTYTYTIAEENIYYISLVCEYGLSQDHWESDNIHLDGYQEQNPRFGAVIYDYTNADRDAEGNPDGIDLTYNFVSLLYKLTDIVINITFIAKPNVLVFSRTIDYQVEGTTDLISYTAGRAPFAGNYSARIDLYWNSWKRDTFATPYQVLDRFYSLTNITSPRFDIKNIDGPASLPSSVYCQFSAITSEDIEIQFSASIFSENTEWEWTYKTGTIFLQRSNAIPHSLYFEDMVFEIGYYYIYYEIEYLGFVIISGRSERFELDGSDPEIDIQFQDVTYFTYDSDGDDFGDSGGVSFNIYSNIPVSVVIETWIWSEGDAYHEFSSYDLDLNSGVSEGQEVIFSPVPFESNYYVDLWVFYRSFPEAFHQETAWYLFELNHIETNNLSTKEESISVLKINFTFSPLMLILMVIISKRYGIKNKNQSIA